MSNNRFKSPIGGMFGRLADRIGNCATMRRVRRIIAARVPMPVLASDVTDVIYATWTVPASAVIPLVPPGVSIVVREGHTLLTVVTYRHGHFGPAFLGGLRRVCPSPLQSNWRLYLTSVPAGAPATAHAVLFLSNIFDSAVYALGTRVFTDILPSHHAEQFTHERHGDSFRTTIGGEGSAPAMKLVTARGAKALPDALQEFFNDWDQAVAFLSLQEAAVAKVSDNNRLCFSEIDLPIDLAAVEPLDTVDYRPGAQLRGWGATAAPFCFSVPAVRFRALSEFLLPDSH